MFNKNNISETYIISDYKYNSDLSENTKKNNLLKLNDNINNNNINCYFESNYEDSYNENN